MPLKKKQKKKNQKTKKKKNPVTHDEMLAVKRSKNLSWSKPLDFIIKTFFVQSRKKTSITSSYLFILGFSTLEIIWVIRFKKTNT